MSTLFSPLKLRGLTLSNRIIVSPMCQYSAVDGSAQAWHVMHLGTLALSGAAMVIIEATGVEPEGRISPADLGLYSDANQKALEPVVAAIRKHSKAALVMQIAHAGRKASCGVPWEGGGGQLALTNGGWTTLAPSAIPFYDKDRAPAELDQTGLTRIRNAFAATAKRAMALGLDGLEVHAAHGNAQVGRRSGHGCFLLRAPAPGSGVCLLWLAARRD